MTHACLASSLGLPGLALGLAVSALVFIIMMATKRHNIGSPTARASVPAYQPVAIMRLEDRRLMSATPIKAPAPKLPPPPPPIVVSRDWNGSGNTITVNGSSASDKITEQMTPFTRFVYIPGGPGENGTVLPVPEELIVISSGSMSVQFLQNADAINAINIFGNAGNDTIVVNAVQGSNVAQVPITIFGGSGADSITVQSDSFAPVTVYCGTGDDKGVVKQGLIKGNVVVFGEAGNDTLTGSACGLYGGIGNDKLVISDGGYARGDEGNNILISKSGYNSLDGGTGNGNNTFYCGTEFTNVHSGGSGYNVIICSTGDVNIAYYPEDVAAPKAKVVTSTGDVTITGYYDSTQGQAPTDLSKILIVPAGGGSGGGGGTVTIQIIDLMGGGGKG